MAEIDLKPYIEAVEQTPTYVITGRVTRVVGLVIEGLGPGSYVGSMCDVYPGDSSQNHFKAEVVGFKDNRILLMPLGDTRGVGPGSRICALAARAVVEVSDGMLGRVLDGLGNPMDGKGPLAHGTEYPLYADPINPMNRVRIHQPLDVGVRAINSCLTCGKGQRVGIFSGSGVGKSTLLGMMARNTAAEVSVIALIGERGREVKEFLERDLGEQGLQRSVVVAATSDQPPLIRLRGAYVAMAIAEYFRDRGRDVLLMMDSLTRFAMAQREVGLSVGEPPTTKGYPPSVFALLPRLLERAGATEKGSITGFFTVLVENDDFNEPISDSARAILDGHIILSRDLASRGHYPSIDILNSVSRCMNDVTTQEHCRSSRRLAATLAVYRRSEDLINIGAYVKGSNKEIDHAIEMIDRIRGFLQQNVEEKVDFDHSVAALFDLYPPRA
jgi:flagellum-specific ATP synthase